MKEKASNESSIEFSSKLEQMIKAKASEKAFKMKLSNEQRGQNSQFNKAETVVKELKNLKLNLEQVSEN